VKDLVKAANLAKVQAANITAQRVMQELGRIAFSDIRRVFTSTGDLKPIHELDDDTAAAIASVDSETRREGRGEDATPVTTKKVRTVDKMAALSLLAKHFKIVGDEGDGVNALASALADRLDRAHRRVNAGMDAVEDAVMVQPQEVTYDPPATNLNLNPNPQPTNPNQEYDDEEPLG
jgi:phage terminase small subunit